MAAVTAQLQSRLDELSRRLAHLKVDLTEPLDPDFAEMAVETEDDTSIEGQAALVSREMASISRALDRVANGTYGQCVKCGAQISARRLEARPEAALCIECASDAR
ncbi:MAG: TraR/DksA family transcriptional regulator [Sphingomonadales bacterium]|nr:TraR/DksA family transcriptional regulator [Sphingomonadales bacterium]MDE2171711.1 TraR/DksA family transcriptional regulator [Sphingomonadales bacterium]